jgi:hypothetical protein
LTVPRMIAGGQGGKRPEISIDAAPWRHGHAPRCSRRAAGFHFAWKTR